MKNISPKKVVTFSVHVFTKLKKEQLSTLPIPQGVFMEGRAIFQIASVESSSNKTKISGIIKTDFSDEQIDRMMLGIEGKLKNKLNKENISLKTQYRIQK